MPNGRGFRFRGYSPLWPYVGLGRGGLPRCWGFGYWGPPPYYQYSPHGEVGYPPYGPPMSREEELNFLRNETDLLRHEMEKIDARIKELEKEG